VAEGQLWLSGEVALVLVQIEPWVEHILRAPGGARLSAAASAGGFRQR